MTTNNRRSWYRPLRITFIRGQCSESEVCFAFGNRYQWVERFRIGEGMRLFLPLRQWVLYVHEEPGQVCFEIWNRSEQVARRTLETKLLGIATDLGLPFPEWKIAV